MKYFTQQTSYCLFTSFVSPGAPAAAPLQTASGQDVHTWIGFISEDGQNIASSIYTGMVTVSLTNNSLIASSVNNKFNVMICSVVLHATYVLH